MLFSPYHRHYLFIGKNISLSTRRLLEFLSIYWFCRWIISIFISWFVESNLAAVVMLANTHISWILENFSFIVEWFFLPSPLLKDVRCCVTFPHIHTRRHSHEINIFENHKTNFSTWFDTISITGTGRARDDAHEKASSVSPTSRFYNIFFDMNERERRENERNETTRKKKGPIIHISDDLFSSSVTLWLFFLFSHFVSLFYSFAI